MHTPGPWHLRGDDGNVVFSEKREMAICAVNIAINEGVSIKQAGTDARLIAAAPEMAEVLNEIQQEEALFAWAKEHGLAGKEADRRIALIRKMLAALKKAGIK